VIEQLPFGTRVRCNDHSGRTPPNDLCGKLIGSRLDDPDSIGDDDDFGGDENGMSPYTTARVTSSNTRLARRALCASQSCTRGRRQLTSGR
jgi:hypothetical protein